MQQYIGSDITSMVTLPVFIFEPMTNLQKMAEVWVYMKHFPLCLMNEIASVTD